MDSLNAFLYIKKLGIKKHQNITLEDVTPHWATKGFNGLNQPRFPHYPQSMVANDGAVNPNIGVIKRLHDVYISQGITGLIPKWARGPRKVD